MLLSLFLAAAPVHAKDYVANVAEAVRYDSGSGWGRAFPKDDGGWWLGVSNANDYALFDLDSEYGLNTDMLTPLTGRSDLQDIGIRQCPGGGYLLVGAADINSSGSAYAWLLNPDWSIKSVGTLAEKDGSHRYNDMPVICSANHRGVGFSSSQGGGVFFGIGGDAGLTGKTTLSGVDTQGGAFIEDPVSGELLVASIVGDGTLTIDRLDGSLTKIGPTWSGPVTSGQNEAYWPSAGMFVGDHLLIAYIQRDRNAGYLEDWGDLWLAIFDGSGSLVENMPIAENTPPDGGMRPGLARRGETLLMTWDRLRDHPPGKVRVEIIEVTLNLSAFGDGAEDSGWTGTYGDTGTANTPSDSGPTGADSGTSGDSGGVGSGDGCGGCAITPAPVGAGWLAGLIGLVGLRRRR